MRKQLNTNGGYALVLVLLFVTIISITLAGLSLKMTNDLKQTDHEQDSQGAYYVAEGGVADVMETIEKRATEIAANEKSSTAFFIKLENEILKRIEIGGFEPNNGEIPEAQVTVTKVDNSVPRKYKIESVGTIGNRERKVAGVFTINFEEGKSGITLPPGMGIYSRTKVSLSGSATITGDVMMDTTSSKTVAMDGGASIKGTVFVPAGHKEPVLDVPSWWSNKPAIETEQAMPTYELPAFPTFPTNYPLAPNKTEKNGSNTHNVVHNGNLYINSWIVSNYTYPLTRNTKFNDIILDSNNKVTFDVGNRDVSIVANSISGSGHIDVKGSGSLTVYLIDTINISQGSINSTGLTDCYIYIGASSRPSSPKEIHLSSNQKINASIYAKDANFHLSGGASLRGLLITGGNTVSIKGGVKAMSQGGSNLIYAPNANVSLLEGGDLYGSVIAKNFTASGGTHVYSKDFSIEDNPMFPDSSNRPASAVIGDPSIKEIQ